MNMNKFSYEIIPAIPLGPFKSPPLVSVLITWNGIDYGTTVELPEMESMYESVKWATERALIAFAKHQLHPKSIPRYDDPEWECMMGHHWFSAKSNICPVCGKAAL